MGLEPDRSPPPGAPPGPENPSQASELAQQACAMRRIGTPFVADVLAAVDRQLDKAPLCARVIRSWGSTAAESAVAMRINAALHALARRGSVPLLTALYAGQHRRFDEAVACALAEHDQMLVEWLYRVPQTNETGRTAALYAALLVLARDHGQPFDLIEIGASAGLNLNLAHYAYDLGGVSFGAQDSDVRIAPLWRGPAPPAATVRIARARGVDLFPLDVNDPIGCERLAAFIFADQPDRVDRLQSAIAIARRHPPCLERGDAAAWLASRLDEPAIDDRHRVVFHSMFMQYVDDDGRAAIEAAIARAGAAASAAHPFACIGFEWNSPRDRVELRLRSWPDGGDRVIAHCHPYGASIDWIDAPSSAMTSTVVMHPKLT